MGAASNFVRAVGETYRRSYLQRGARPRQGRAFLRLVEWELVGIAGTPWKDALGGPSSRLGAPDGDP